MERPSLRVAARSGGPELESIPGLPHRGGESALGEAVARRHDAAPHPEGSEALLEGLDAVREDRLGAVQEDPERRQVDPGEILWLDLPEAEVERELRRDRR